VKQFKITLIIDVPEEENEGLLTSSIADDVIHGYQQIESVEYEWKHVRNG
jgi:hypothetical protein